MDPYTILLTTFPVSFTTHTMHLVGQELSFVVRSIFEPLPAKAFLHTSTKLPLIALVRLLLIEGALSLPGVVSPFAIVDSQMRVLYHLLALAFSFAVFPATNIHATIILYEQAMTVSPVSRVDLTDVKPILVCLHILQVSDINATNSLEHLR